MTTAQMHRRERDAEACLKRAAKEVVGCQEAIRWGLDEQVYRESQCKDWGLRTGARRSANFAGIAARSTERSSVRAAARNLPTKDNVGSIAPGSWTPLLQKAPGPSHIHFQPQSDAPRQTSTFSAAMNASCGMSTLPNWRIFFLPSFCFSRSFRLRVTSPP